MGRFMLSIACGLTKSEKLVYQQSISHLTVNIKVRLVQTTQAILVYSSLFNQPLPLPSPIFHLFHLSSFFPISYSCSPSLPSSSPIILRHHILRPLPVFPASFSSSSPLPPSSRPVYSPPSPSFSSLPSSQSLTFLLLLLCFSFLHPLLSVFSLVLFFLRLISVLSHSSQSPFPLPLLFCHLLVPFTLLLRPLSPLSLLRYLLLSFSSSSSFAFPSFIHSYPLSPSLPSSSPPILLRLLPFPLPAL